MKASRPIQNLRADKRALRHALRALIHHIDELADRNKLALHPLETAYKPETARRAAISYRDLVRAALKR